MQNLYAPWREKYVTDVHDKDKKKSSCVFCDYAQQKEHDEQSFILERTQNCFVIMNRYPYNAGHILIIPYEHCANLYDVTEQVRGQLMELSSLYAEKMKTILGADGVNIGINMGSAAGAGIPDHLHMHVLPRWQSDTNFLPTLAGTKQISVDVATVYEKLKKAS